MKQDPDEVILQQADQPVDDAALLKLLNKSTGRDADLKAIPGLVQDLTSPSFAKRETAFARLAALGLPAVDALQAARRGRDHERAARAKSCLDQIERQRNPRVAQAAVRLLVRRNVKAAVPALLRYLPYAVEEELEEEVWFGLDSLTVRQGHVDEAVKAAVRDGVSPRRAVAAYLLGRRGAGPGREAARKLLADPDAWVRLRAAQGLLAIKDREAIPPLVELLKAEPVTLAWQAEELLHWATGEGAPEAVLGAGTAAERDACSKAWAAWWRRDGAQLDLARLDRDHRRPGLVLIAQTDVGGKRGARRVLLCGCDGQPRWQVPDADIVQLLPGGRVLLTSAGAVMERDLRNHVLWRAKPIKIPSFGNNLNAFRCERLLNGNTFAAGYTAFAEITPDGDAALVSEFASKYIATIGDLRNPQRLGPNRYLYEAFSWKDQKLFALVLFGPAGDVIRRIDLHAKIRGAGVPEPLPSGSFLITARYDTGRVYELTPSGKVVWKSGPLGALHAVRLRNGNTLVGCYLRLAEVEPGGRVVWEARLRGDSLRPCLSLIRLGFDAPRPPSWDVDGVANRIKGLSSKDPAVRLYSAFALEEMKRKAVAAVPALLEAADDPDARVRKEVGRALDAVVGPDSLPALARAAKDRRPRVRAAAFDHFSVCRDTGATAVPLVLAGMRDQDAEVRRAAATAAGFFPRDGRVLIPALIASLKDRTKKTKTQQTSVAQAAANALGRFGTAAETAVPTLVEFLKEGDYGERHTVLLALGHVGRTHKATVPVLTAFMKDERQGYLRVVAGHALGLLGAHAKAAVPDLLCALKALKKASSKDASALRWTVVDTLGKIGPAAGEAAPTLRALLNEEGTDRDLHRVIVEALARIQN